MYLRDGLHINGQRVPFLPRDCQGRLPVAWVNKSRVFKLIGQGPGLSKKTIGGQKDSQEVIY